MFEQENAFYAAHQTEFQEKYYDKWLVIIGESLWGVYDTLKEAAQNAMEHFKPGEFMVHRPSDDGKIIEVGPSISVKYPDGSESHEPNYTLTASGDDLKMFTYA